MKRHNILYICLIIILCLAGSATYAQVAPAASATGQIIAEIIPVFSAKETSPLNFGRFAPGPEGGKIILTPQSTVSVLGSVFKGQGSCNAASFYVSGDADAAYSISLPTGPVVLRHTSDAKTMLVDNWISQPEQGTGTGMLKDGFQVVYVGATLNVGTLNDNPVGVYTGSFNITFDFY